MNVVKIEQVEKVVISATFVLGLNHQAHVYSHRLPNVSKIGGICRIWKKTDQIRVL